MFGLLGYAAQVLASDSEDESSCPSSCESESEEGTSQTEDDADDDDDPDPGQLHAKPSEERRLEDADCQRGHDLRNLVQEEAKTKKRTVEEAATKSSRSRGTMWDCRDALNRDGAILRAPPQEAMGTAEGETLELHQAGHCAESAAAFGHELGRRAQCLCSALAAPVVDKMLLADLLWRGVPEELGGSTVRRDAWQMLLGYRPLAETRRGAALRRKRLEYMELREDLLSCEAGDEAIATKVQIRKDLPRTELCGLKACGEVAGLQALVDDERMQALLERVLFFWSVRQPASGYVQGINDVLLPFVFVFLAAGDPSTTGKRRNHSQQNCAEVSLGPWALDTLSAEELAQVESDCYWCLTKILAEVIDYYLDGQPGLQRVGSTLRWVLARAHTGLAANVEQQGLDMAMIAMRWLSCLMVRTLPPPLCMRLWDTCIAESARPLNANATSGISSSSGGGFSGFLVYFSASLFVSYADVLEAASFDEMVAFVQHPPTDHLTLRDLEVIISKAYVLRTVCEGEDLNASSAFVV